MPASASADERIGERRARGVENGHDGKGRSCRRGGGEPPWLSQVLRPMWWWYPPAEMKAAWRAVALHQLEAEHAAIEGERAVEIGHFQVDMADR